MTDAVPPPTIPAPQPKRRRWLVIGLIASLALNALMLGAVLRSLWHVRAGTAITGGTVGQSLPAFVDSLPKERRDALRRHGGHGRAGAHLRPLRGEIRRARLEAARLFVADPFDKQAFIAAQNRLADLENQFRASVQKALPEIGESLTAAERRQYLRCRAPHMLRERRGGGGPPDDGGSR